MARRKKAGGKKKTAVARKKSGGRKKAATPRRKTAAARKKAGGHKKKTTTARKKTRGIKKKAAGRKKPVTKKKPAAKKKAAARKKPGAKKKALARKKPAVKKKPAAKKKAAARKKPGAKKKAPARKKPVAKKKPSTGKKAVTKKKAVAGRQTAVATLRKIIVVIGATGAQGGGLAHAILSDPLSKFAVRAVTRNPNSDKARELARLGAEVVSANLDDVGSLKKAFNGAYGAFCVTNFWEHFSPERELAQAANMAEAAKAAKLRHVIWSTLEDTRHWIPLSDTRMPTLMGKYKVPHFDAKGEANHEFSDRSVPTTFLVTSFYWDNLIHFGMGPQPDADGVLAITLPMGNKRLPGMASVDIGRCAYGVFQNAKEYVGKTAGIAGEFLTGHEMAAALSKALGKVVRYNAVEPEVYRGFGFPGADDLGNMFQFNRDFSEQFCAARNLNESRKLNPSLQTFAAWLMRHKKSIPLPE